MLPHRVDLQPLTAEEHPASSDQLLSLQFPDRPLSFL